MACFPPAEATLSTPLRHLTPADRVRAMVSHEGHVDEHVLAAGKTNPAGCTPPHTCTGHDASHTHGGQCGHEAVPHGDHVDYVVNGHLHHSHDRHCDNHGAVALARG